MVGQVLGLRLALRCGGKVAVVPPLPAHGEHLCALDTRLIFNRGHQHHRPAVDVRDGPPPVSCSCESPGPLAAGWVVHVRRTWPFSCLLAAHILAVDLHAQGFGGIDQSGWRDQDQLRHIARGYLQAAIFHSCFRPGWLAALFEGLNAHPVSAGVAKLSRSHGHECGVFHTLVLPEPLQQRRPVDVLLRVPLVGVGRVDRLGGAPGHAP